MEQVFKVNGDQTISCPMYVGSLRGVREYASMQTWHLNQMRPRYNQFNWKDMWRNIRLIGKRALAATVTNASVGVLSVAKVDETPVVVTVSGPTEFSSLVHESITMDTTTKQTTNAFVDYVAIKKDRVSSVDVTLSDVDGKVLATIPNNELQSLYQVVDVSSCPWLPSNTSKMDNYLELLYKKRLPYLSDDADEFPAFDYDNVLVNKMMQLWAEEQEKLQIAQAYDAKATRSAARIHDDQNKATEDEVALVAHPHDTMLRRIGNGVRRRYSYFAGRKY